MPPFSYYKRFSVVEFEYSDKNYFRTTVHEAIHFQWKNLSVFTQVYAEQDAKTNQLLIIYPTV